MLKLSIGLHVAIALLVMILSYGLMWNRIICPAEIRPYVAKFEAEAKKQNASYKHFFILRIEFSDKLKLETSAAESYKSLEQRNKLIYVNKWAWQTLSEEQREMLIVHELGHAILHRAHVETKLMDGSPFSIMYPSLFESQLYSRNVQHYWKELFSKQGDMLE